MTVLLISLYDAYNFAVRQLHAYLKTLEGVRPVSVFLKCDPFGKFDLTTEEEEEKLLSLVNEHRPQLIGFSLLTAHYPLARHLTRMLKRVTPASVIVWGGIHTTLTPETCLEDADIVCVGEGEGVLKDLTSRLQENRGYQDIANCWVKAKGAVVKNPLRPLLQELDALPLPAIGDGSFYFIEPNAIRREDPLLVDKKIYIKASRGCPFRCSFCFNSVITPQQKGLGPQVRRRSVLSVINEIKHQRNISAVPKESVAFEDENFPHEDSWLNEFIDKYRQEVRLPFSLQMYPGFVPDALLPRLRDAGLNEIQLGFQSGIDQVRDDIFNRPDKNKDLVRLANQVQALGIKTKYYFILDNPYETAAHMEETIKLLGLLPQPVKLVLFSLQYFPGYVITAKAAAEGKIKKNQGLFNRPESKYSHMKYEPRIFPITRKNILQNIIWLIGYRKKDARVLFPAVLSRSLGAGLKLFCLHLQTVIEYRIWGPGGLQEQDAWIIRWPKYLGYAVNYFVKGQWGLLWVKARKHFSPRAAGKIAPSPG